MTDNTIHINSVLSIDTSNALKQLNTISRQVVKLDFDNNLSNINSSQIGKNLSQVITSSLSEAFEQSFEELNDIALRRRNVLSSVFGSIFSGVFQGIGENFGNR